MARPPENGKAKSAAERKRRQRERMAKFDIKPVEVKLAKSEREILERNCKLRGGVRGAYEMDEYISTLIRNDEKLLEKQLAELGSCKKCGNPLPGGCEGLFKGESDCWHFEDAKCLDL